jgi:hypothetical protein
VFPRPNVEGIRKAPFFVSASQLPFVRWKKPQPPYVSRVIRDLQKQRQHRHDRRYALMDYFIPLAKNEDEWDERMLSLMKQQENDKEKTDGTWLAPMLAQLDDVSESIMEMNKKSSELAKRMLDVVNQEKQLVETEKVERRRAAWERRQAMKVDTVKSIMDAHGQVATSVRGGVTDIGGRNYTPAVMEPKSVDKIIGRDALTRLEEGLKFKKKRKWK